MTSNMIWRIGESKGLLETLCLLIVSKYRGWFTRFSAKGKITSKSAQTLGCYIFSEIYDQDLTDEPFWW